MKLQCQVEAVNRLHCNLGNKPVGRYLKSTLAIAKEPKLKKEKETDYVLLHFSSVNKTGVKYKIMSIKQVFVKCLDKGLCTIRFEEPPVDLCIKSEVVQLKCFLRLIKSCLTGDAKDLDLQKVSNLNVTPKNNAPVKMVIRDRSQYPILPRTLEYLGILGQKLHNFRSDILLLRNLVFLDLSDNEIEKIPPELGTLPNLAEVVLTNNNLGTPTNPDWQWLFGAQITEKLRLLDLTGNKISYLPKTIWKLQNLVTLKLDNNKLVKLPKTIGRIGSLSYLTLSRNKLETLPSSLLQCRLERIDICQNYFHLIADKSRKWKRNCKPWNVYIKSLLHLASKSVLKYKLYYGPNIIPWTLVEFLDNGNICTCGEPVVSDTLCMNKKFDLKNFCNVVEFDDNNKSSSVCFECYFCSPMCFAITAI